MNIDPESLKPLSKNPKELNDSISLQKHNILEQKRLANLVLIEEALMKSVFMNSFFLFQKDETSRDSSMTSLKQKASSMNPSPDSYKTNDYRTSSHVSKKAK